jgi:hypothetical protein
MRPFPSSRWHATSSRRASASVLLLFAAASSGGVANAHAQQIRGRVVDEQSRSALVESTVTLYAGADSTRIDRAGTAADGFFILTAPGPGQYRIIVERIGYSPAERDITLVDQRELLVPAFVLRSEAIALDTITARGEATRQSATIDVGFTRASHLIAGSRLAMLERTGTTVDAAVRQLGAGLRVRDYHIPGMIRVLTCVELTRRLPSFRPSGDSNKCDMVALVLDGMTIPDPFHFYQDLRLRDIESIEYVPAAEAGLLYGMEASARGALVVWTLRRGPHRSEDRIADRG